MFKSIHFKIAALLAIVWIIFKLVFYFIEQSEMSFTPGVMLNLLFVLLAAAAGLFMSRKKNNFAETHFLDDFKNTMRACIIYTLFITGFVYIYYGNIDTSFMERRVAEKVTLAKDQVSTPEKLKQLKEENPNLKRLKAEDYIENVKADATTIHSAYVQSTLTLLALLVLSLLYSLAVVVIFRKLVFRTQQ